jgi:hypothetical protein
LALLATARERRPALARAPTLVAKTRIRYEPVRVDELVVTLRVDAWPGFTEAGSNVAVAPRGRPEARNETDRAEPFLIVIRIRDVAERPCRTETFAGAERRESLTWAWGRCPAAAIALPGSASEATPTVSARRPAVVRR